MPFATKSLSLLLQSYPSDCLLLTASTLQCISTYFELLILISLCPLLFPSLSSTSFSASCQPHDPLGQHIIGPHPHHEHPVPHPPPGYSNLWPEVRLPHGIVRGRTFRTNHGRDFYAFLGIPYATPPLGPLRFKV